MVQGLGLRTAFAEGLTGFTDNVVFRIGDCQGSCANTSEQHANFLFTSTKEPSNLGGRLQP